MGLVLPVNFARSEISKANSANGFTTWRAAFETLSIR